MEHKDYYTILGVPRDADGSAIRQAYRTLARKFHPDLNGGDPEAERTFKELNEAYSVLSDAEKRRAYDQYGRSWRPQGANASNFNWSGWFGDGKDVPPKRQRPHTTTEEFSQSVNQARGEEPGRSGERPEERGRAEGGHSPFSEFFQQLFTGGEPGAPSYTSRLHVGERRDHLPIEITLEEAFWGASRTIQQGSERFEILIPKGVKTGSKVRINRGHEQLNLLVEVRRHSIFNRDEDDLQTNVKVDLYTALLGGEIQVPTLEGSLLLVVPPNTQNGRIFRLKGQGMPFLKNPDLRGDLYAEIQVELPVPLSEEERRRFVELRWLRRDSNDLFS